MDIDRRLTIKADELTKLKAERDKIELLHEVKPGEPVTYIAPERIMQSGELEIMEEIALAEFQILSIEKRPTPESKPLTWRHFIDLKKKELEEHREMMTREGYGLVKFEYGE